METPEPAPSPQPGSSEMVEVESGDKGNWEPGPNLKSPGWMRCRFSVLGFALKHHGIQILIMAIALALIIDLVLKWDELRPPMHIQISMPMITGFINDVWYVLWESPTFFQNGTIASPKSPSTWVDWWVYVQSLLGGGTLLVALFVWHAKIKEEWTDSLPKRMSVFFFHQGRPAIICRYVWLADEGDQRAWGQQVAAQAVCEQFLYFHPNVKSDDPRLLIWTDNTICRHYNVCFELKDKKEPKQNIFLSKCIGMCRYQNLAASNNVSTVPLVDLQRIVPAHVFPFCWPEKQATSTETMPHICSFGENASANDANASLGQKMDILIQKQDQMQNLQGELINNATELKKILKGNLDQRIEKLESELIEIKAVLKSRGII